MKENYLWDKTGGDIEIERLENALKAFRYQEIAPPALPAKIIPFEKKSPFRFFRFSFASAAFAALMFVCLSVWLLYSPKKIEVAKDLPEAKKIEVAKDSRETIVSQIEKKDSDAILAEKPNDLIVGKVGKPKRAAKQNVAQVRKVVPTKIRQNNLIARNVEAKKPEVKLTKEEKYAYDQLMLALSITGSKLKLVSDKVSGGEE
jgi:hypothetical protein